MRGRCGTLREQPPDIKQMVCSRIALRNLVVNLVAERCSLFIRSVRTRPTTGPRSGGTALRPPGRSTVPHPFFLSYGSPEDQTTPPPHGAVRRSSGVRAVRYRPNDFSAGWRNVESPLGADASAVPPCTAERPIFRIGEQPPRYTVQSRICAVHLSSRLRTTIPHGNRHDRYESGKSCSRNHVTTHESRLYDRSDRFPKRQWVRRPYRLARS